MLNKTSFVGLIFISVILAGCSSYDVDVKNQDLYDVYAQQPKQKVDQWTGYSYVSKDLVDSGTGQTGPGIRERIGDVTPTFNTSDSYGYPLRKDEIIKRVWIKGRVYNDVIYIPDHYIYCVFRKSTWGSDQ